MESGFFPLDEELELVPGKLTPLMAEGLVRLGVWMPFERSAIELQYFMHVTVSAAKARRDTEQAGAAYVAVQAAEVERIQRDLPESPAGVDKAFLSVDGAFVPVVGGEWVEVKTLTLGEIQPPDSQGEVHTTNMSYFSRLSEARDFTPQALVETHRRGLEKSRTVCADTDGAEWIQGFVDWHRPDAVRILDFMHAAERVAGAGRVVHGEDTPEFQAWFASQRHELKDGDPDQVLDTLDQLRQTAVAVGAPESVRPVIDTNLNYLRTRRAMIDYARFQQAGYPIGSGAGEACHKFVIESRLKGTGMRWARSHVNPMAALRNLVCNNRWDEGWAQIADHLRQHSHHRHTPNAQPTPNPCVADNPGASGPLLPPGFKLRPGCSWRNRPFGKMLYRPSSESPGAKL